MSSVGGGGIDEPEVTDGDIDPAIDAHANAVGGVVGAAFVQLIGGDPLDQHLLSIGSAVVIVVMKEAQQWWVQHPEFVVVEEQSAWVVHLGERIDLVGLSVAVGVAESQDVALSECVAEGPLLVDSDKQRPIGGGCEADGVIDLGRLCEHCDLDIVGCDDVVECSGRADECQRQWRQQLGARFKFPETGPLARARSQKSDSQEPRLGRIDCVQDDASESLVLRVVDEGFPVGSIDRVVDLIAIGRASGFPMDSQRPDVLSGFQFHLPGVSVLTIGGTPSGSGVSIDGMSGEVVFGGLFAAGGCRPCEGDVSSAAALGDGGLGLGRLFLAGRRLAGFRVSEGKRGSGCQCRSDEG